MVYATLRPPLLRPKNIFFGRKNSNKKKMGEVFRQKFFNKFYQSSLVTAVNGKKRERGPQDPREWTRCLGGATVTG